MNDSAYYDSVHKEVVAKRSTLGGWMDERYNAVLPYVVGSVMDVGCGLGEMSNLVDGTYCGIDFSDYAIKHARENNRNVHATFHCLNIMSLKGGLKFDTVLMLELLEHLPNYLSVIAYATSHANRRVIVTVPRDMPGRAHFHPRWNKGKLVALLGDLLACHMFGGDGDRWWLAVKEV